MQAQPLQPISREEHAARLARVEVIGRRNGFVGAIEYRHAISGSGGAQYAMGPTIEQDMLVVDAQAFQRDSTDGDFSLEAMIAHERGHQLVCRHERLRRNTPQAMSAVTEEVLASLVGALIVHDAADGEKLILKALGDLVERGMGLAEASRHVERVLSYLEAIL